MPPFERVAISGDMPVGRKPGQSWAEAFDAFCRELARVGFTHVQVNYLADPYHSILLEQPNNYYAWFADYGASLDQFVTSDLFERTYLEAHLDRNRQKLLAAADAVRRNGLKPHLLLCEPRFVPERFLAAHPQLRGPRVDNPACSTTPWYALCTDIPAVQEHYRQMMRRLMELVPDIDSVSLFTHDSGSGFCHSNHLYSGPNGPRHCKGINFGQRVAAFLGNLVSAAREVNPNFMAALGTGPSEQERKDFIAAMGEGVTCEAIGAYSWHGGLEDHWAQQQYGRRLKDVGYEQARAERVEEFRQWVDLTHQSGHDAIGVNNLPTDGYMGPLRYVIHPHENLRILGQLRDMGVKHLHARGSLSPLVEFSVNREVLRAFMDDPDRTMQSGVRDIARQWVGDEHADTLFEAWGLAEEAYVTRPMWTYAVGRKAMIVGPLVPDPGGVSREEMAYVWHAGWDDLESLPGRHRLGEIGIADEADRTWFLETYRGQTLPLLEKAEGLLRGELKRCRRDDARRCLREQADHIRSFALWLRCMYNWIEAGCYLLPGKGTPSPQRTIGEIVDDEIVRTKDMLKLYDGHLERFIHTDDVHGTLHGYSPRFMDQLAQRIEVMRCHRNDSIVPIELGSMS